MPTPRQRLKTADFYIEFNINTTSIDDVFENIRITYGTGKILNYSIKPLSYSKPSLKSIAGKIEVIEVEKLITATAPKF
jgi:hypothetical protein